MREWKKVLSCILVSFMAISCLHVWLNIGFSKLSVGGLTADENRVQVGFLPVT